jgi:hypothetical protein
VRQDKEEESVDRLRRMTDLFVEGKELNLGDDEAGTPVLLWINKLNSFEDDEARRDGMAARTARMLELQDEENPEMRVVRTQMARWDADEMVVRVAAQKYEEDYLAAVDDVEATEEWAGRMDFLRRGDTLNDDAKLPEDDPRREQFEKLDADYMVAINAATDKRQLDRRRVLSDLSRSELEDMYTDSLTQRLGIEVFLQERRVTEIFYATRDCVATITDGVFDHKGCDHQRLLPDRKSVRDLPSNVIARVVETLDELTMDRRTAGNSDAPVTSSESSEQPKQVEELPLSIPEVTAPVVART